MGEWECQVLWVRGGGASVGVRVRACVALGLGGARLGARTNPRGTGGSGCAQACAVGVGVDLCTE